MLPQTSHMSAVGFVRDQFQVTFITTLLTSFVITDTMKKHNKSIQQNTLLSTAHARVRARAHAHAHTT